MSTNTLREQRRNERARRQRKQNIILFSSIGILVIFIGLITYLQLSRPAREARTATATAEVIGATQTAAFAVIQGTSTAQAADAVAAAATQLAQLTPPGTPSSAERIVTGSGLAYQDIVVGTGNPAAVGSSVTVHYTGWLADGTMFESSYSGDPFTLVLGNRSVIAGWEEGLLGMQVGGIRKLIIPSDLGYGDSGSGSIPPGATLIFEVEMIAIE